MSEESTQKNLFQESGISTSSLSDFHAKIYLWLENSKDFMESEAVYFLRLCESLRLPSPIFLSLKTSKDFYHQTVEETLQPFCEGSLPTLGFMSVNGNCLIQAGFYPKIESGFTLSDIMQEGVDPKYFLSEKVILRFQRRGMGQTTNRDSKIREYKFINERYEG